MWQVCKNIFVLHGARNPVKERNGIIKSDYNEDKSDYV